MITVKPKNKKKPMKIGFRKQKGKTATVAIPIGNLLCACGKEVSYSRMVEHVKTCPANREAAAQMLGAKGGSVKSEAKAKAARKNGKLGGRPKKENK